MMKLLVLLCVLVNLTASGKASGDPVHAYDLDSWVADLGDFDSEDRGGVQAKETQVADVQNSDEVAVGPPSGTQKCCMCCNGRSGFSASGGCSMCKDGIRSTFALSALPSEPPATSAAKADACKAAYQEPSPGGETFEAIEDCIAADDGVCPLPTDPTFHNGDQLPKEVIYIRHGHKGSDPLGYSASQFTEEPDEDEANWRLPLTQSGTQNDPKAVMQFLYEYITSKTAETSWKDVVIYSSPWRRTVATSSCLMQKLRESTAKLTGGKPVKQIKLKLDKGLPEKKHPKELPFRGEYPCRHGCPSTLNNIGTNGPTCDQYIVDLVQTQCGETWTQQDWTNGVGWIDQTYKNTETDQLHSGPSGRVDMSSSARRDKVWETLIHNAKYQPDTLVIIFGHGTFGQDILTKYVVSSTWRRTNWPTGTMTFMRWATPDEAGGTPTKLKAVGEKYPFVNSGNLNRLGKCAISTEVAVEYKRGSRKTGKIVNWQGTNGIPTFISIKLDKPENAPCIIDFFNCKHATNGAGQNDYRCTMAGYRGAFDDCSRNGFANTFDAGILDVKWNSLSGQDALNNDVNHVKIYNFVAGSGPYASLPTCSGASANTQSHLDSEVQVSQSINEPVSPTDEENTVGKAMLDKFTLLGSGRGVDAKQRHPNLCTATSKQGGVTGSEENCALHCYRQPSCFGFESGKFSKRDVEYGVCDIYVASGTNCKPGWSFRPSDNDFTGEVTQTSSAPSWRKCYVKEGSRTDTQSDLDSEAKVSSNESVSEGVFPENKRSILLLSIAVTVFCISLRHYRNKAAGPKEALTMLLEDEI